jgi:hypothetical protein
MTRHDILSVVVHKHDVALTNTMRRFANELIDTAVKAERAKIVAWLRSEANFCRTQGVMMTASQIEAGDHLK